MNSPVLPGILGGALILVIFIWRHRHGRTLAWLLVSGTAFALLAADSYRRFGDTPGVWIWSMLAIWNGRDAVRLSMQRRQRGQGA